MTSNEIRQKYLEFFKDRDHVQIEPAELVLENDPTTLFVSSGMQPLVPYLLGEIHPDGVRLVDSQPTFRAEDIEEVGDNRHDTLFEMLGNWSLGDYFKKQEIEWLYQFLFNELKLDKNKVYFTVFEGNEMIPKDDEAFKTWTKLGISEDHIYFYGTKKNWWSRSGPPEVMPVREIGGPCTEVFYEFTDVEHSDAFGKECHPNCDCGRFMEIGNSVFIEYKKVGDGQFENLPQQNVDFGGGLERLLSAANNEQDMFKCDLHWPIIEKLEQELDLRYGDDEKTTAALRITADHIKASAFLIKSGVAPSNKLQGYILRRLLRRAALKLNQIKEDAMDILSKLVDPVIDIYSETDYFQTGDWDPIRKTIDEEVQRFKQTLSKGLKEVEKVDQINGKVAFDLYQSYGFPLELTEEIFQDKGQIIDHAQFEAEFKKHQEQSRSASVGIFKGGLAGHSEVEIKYHTTTHLLHQALRDVLGPTVFQKGSNITLERLRFDFSFDRKLTEEEVRQVEDIINQRIKEGLEVEQKTLSLQQAKALNAIGLFDEKYGDSVNVYGVGPDYKIDQNSKDQRVRGNYYSLEFCGGPHVKNTKEIGGVKIQKEEAVSQGMRRIRAVVV